MWSKTTSFSDRCTRSRTNECTLVPHLDAVGDVEVFELAVQTHCVRPTHILRMQQQLQSSQTDGCV